MPENPSTVALTTIIKTLEPLGPEERRRLVSAAMTFLGEDASQVTDRASFSATIASATDYPQPAVAWMKQNSISTEELDQVFHFNGDGIFDIHDAPGKSQKEKTLNTYILTGLGRYLTSGEREFDDKLARDFCNTIGCLDQGNHAKYLKDKGPEFSGDKAKGYSITNVGLKRGAVLVKELAGASK